MINLKQKLKNNERTIGSWLTIANPIIAEMMAEQFDWLVIDMEHSAITLSECQDLVRLIEAKDCVPLVRVSENNTNLIKRVLDTGAWGIIVPMVNSKDDALKALSATHYPPKGTRGVGLARAQNYGFDFDSYKEWLEKEVVVIAQIEHINAVDNIKDILQTDIDGIIVGPYDISASLHAPGEFCTFEFKSILRKIVAITQKFNKSLGMHIIPPYASELKKYPEYNFLALSLDTLFIGKKIEDELNETNKGI